MPSPRRARFFTTSLPRAPAPTTRTRAARSRSCRHQEIKRSRLYRSWSSITSESDDRRRSRRRAAASRRRTVVNLRELLSHRHDSLVADCSNLSMTGIAARCDSAMTSTTRRHARPATRGSSLDEHDLIVARRRGVSRRRSSAARLEDHRRRSDRRRAGVVGRDGCRPIVDRLRSTLAARRSAACRLRLVGRRAATGARSVTDGMTSGYIRAITSAKFRRLDSADGASPDPRP